MFTGATHKSIAEGLVGSAASFLGLVTSLQEQLEYGLRIVSLLIGIVVGIVTLIRMLRK
jgi:hypothetical protein